MSLSGNPPEGSYLEPSADFQPICGRKNTKDDPKVVFFLCFSLSPCNDFQLVAILCPNLIHYLQDLTYRCRLLAFNVAERTGFEPVEPVAQLGSLANYWFQPLTHLSDSVDACR